MERWDVSQKESGLSLQLFLKHQLGEEFSGKHIKRLIDAGKCLLNGKAERFSSRLVGKGDRIELMDIPSIQKPITAKVDAVNRILYADNDLIAYDKPSGVSSDSSIISASLQKQFANFILLHRLDKETTGVLLFARHEEAAKAMLNLFKKRLIKKTYLAIVHGTVPLSRGIVENYLGKLHAYHGQTIWGAVPKEKGLWSKTSWEVKKKGKEASLVSCHPETGRTHQIRVHLSELGHPILGDHQYGWLASGSYSPPRILLHASDVVFEHPITHKKVHILSPLPQDFSEAAKIVMGGI